MYTLFEEYLEALDVVNEFYNKMECVDNTKILKDYIDELKINDIIKNISNLIFLLEAICLNHSKIKTMMRTSVVF